MFWLGELFQTTYPGSYYWASVKGKFPCGFAGSGYRGNTKSFYFCILSYGLG